MGQQSLTFYSWTYIFFFTKADIAQVELIKSCLAKFDGASGQRVNFATSRVFFCSNINENKARELSTTSGTRIMSDLGKYLGVRMVHQRNSRALHEEILTRFSKKVAG